MKLVSLRNPQKKGLYMLAFDYWFSYDDHDPRVWCEILNFGLIEQYTSITFMIVW